MSILKTIGRALKPVAPVAKAAVTIATPVLAAAAGQALADAITKAGAKVTKPKS